VPITSAQREPCVGLATSASALPAGVRFGRVGL
jgi:hypothetical protein